MAYQFTTTPIFLNPYITYKLNNINKVKVFNKEHKYWTRYYYKILQEIETIIDVQKQVWDIVKLAEKINTTIIEAKETIL